jgi:hypothetical protein
METVGRTERPILRPVEGTKKPLPIEVEKRSKLVRIFSFLPAINRNRAGFGTWSLKLAP